MKKSKYTDEQIAFALKQAETGTVIVRVPDQALNYRDWLGIDPERFNVDGSAIAIGYPATGRAGSSCWARI